MSLPPVVSFLKQRQSAVVFRLPVPPPSVSKPIVPRILTPQVPSAEKKSLATTAPSHEIASEDKEEDIDADESSSSVQSPSPSRSAHSSTSSTPRVIKKPVCTPTALAYPTRDYRYIVNGKCVYQEGCERKFRLPRGLTREKSYLGVRVYDIEMPHAMFKSPFCQRQFPCHKLLDSHLAAYHNTIRPVPPELEPLVCCVTACMHR
jgi:hypothetical protein